MSSVECSSSGIHGNSECNSFVNSSVFSIAVDVSGIFIFGADWIVLGEEEWAELAQNEGVLADLCKDCSKFLGMIIFKLCFLLFIASCSNLAAS